jgi:integrase
LKAAIKEYLESFTGRSVKTIKKKEFLLKHLEEFGVDDEWDEKKVKSFYEYIASKGLAISTIKDIFREVKSYLRWLRRKKHYAVFIDEDAFRSVFQAQRLKVKKKKEIFTDEELGKVFSYCDKKPPIYKVFFLLLLHSGLRVNEALNLSAEDLIIKKIEQREFLFLKVREGKFGKERETPMLLLSEEEKEFFKRFFASRKNKPLWFYILKYPKRAKEKVLTFWSVEKFCQRAEKELGFPIYPHKFRYTWISRMLSEGYSIHAVQTWAGHEKATTTLEIYAVVMTEKELLRKT